MQGERDWKLKIMEPVARWGDKADPSPIPWLPNPPTSMSNRHLYIGAFSITPATSKALARARARAKPPELSSLEIEAKGAVTNGGPA